MIGRLREAYLRFSRNGVRRPLTDAEKPPSGHFLGSPVATPGRPAMAVEGVCYPPISCSAPSRRPRGVARASSRSPWGTRPPCHSYNVSIPTRRCRRRGSSLFDAGEVRGGDSPACPRAIAGQPGQAARALAGHRHHRLADEGPGRLPGVRDHAGGGNGAGDQGVRAERGLRAEGHLQ